MAKSRVKGIVLEIGGDVTSLSKAIKSVTADARSTQTELNKINRLLKMDPDNVVLLRQKQELLNESIEKTQSVLTSLRDAKDKADADMANGTEVNEKAYRELERQIEYSEIALRNARKEADDLADKLHGVDEQPVEEVADAADEAEDALSDAKEEAASFGDVLKAGMITEAAGQIVDAVKDLSQETQEYRKIMGSLEVSSERAGYTAEQTQQAYTELYGILADDQSAATALANLQALGLEQNQLMGLIQNVIGGWAAYGDSIPIDSLAEAINETAKTGKVTGTFADILNWGAKEGETYGVKLQAATEANEDWNMSVQEATTAEDYFNLALSQCSTEAERANLIQQAMADQGLAAVGEQWRQNNQSMVEANETQAAMQEQMAQLGEAVEPLITTLTGMVVKALEWFNSMGTGTQTTILAILALVAVLGPLSTAFTSVSTAVSTAQTLLPLISTGFSSVKGSIGSVISTLPSLQTVFSSVMGFIAANPIVLLITAIVALVALIATKGDEIQAILQKVDDFMQGVFATDWTNVFGPVLGGALNAFFANIKVIWDAVMQILNGVIDFIRGVFTGNWERAWSGIQQIFGGIFDGLVGLAKSPINMIISMINAAIDGVNWFIGTLNRIPGVNIGSIGHLPMLASGGIVSSGSAIVGEAGPELLTVAGGRAMVQPLSSTTNNATHLGGVNITIYGAPGQSEEDLVDILMDRMQHECDIKGAAIHG